MNDTALRNAPPRLIWHLGYPKCASTTLQEMFAASSQLNYLSFRTESTAPNAFQSHPDTKRFLRLLTRENSAGDEKQRLWTSHIQPALSDDLPNVISDETFLMGDRSAEDFAREICDFYPLSEFLIVKRDRAQLVLSMFQMMDFVARRQDAALDLEAWFTEQELRFPVGFFGALRIGALLEALLARTPATRIHLLDLASLFVEDGASHQRLLAILGDASESDLSRAIQTPRGTADSRGAKLFFRRMMGPVPRLTVSLTPANRSDRGPPWAVHPRPIASAHRHDAGPTCGAL